MFNSVQWNLKNKDPVYSFTIPTFHLAPHQTKQNRLLRCAPHVYQDLSARRDWPVKKPLSICQSGWKEIRNALPVIRWICWGPRTRSSALLRRRYLLKLNYFCEAGYFSTLPWLTQEKEFNLGIQIDNNVALTLSRCLFCFRSVKTVWSALLPNLFSSFWQT